MAAALAVLVSAPSIATGLQLDDLLQRAALEKIEPYATWVPSPWKLFNFFDGDIARNARLRDLGSCPGSEPAAEGRVLPARLRRHPHRRSGALPARAVGHAPALDGGYRPSSHWSRSYRRLLAARLGRRLGRSSTRIDDAHAVAAA